MTILQSWAMRHGVSQAALDDLMRELRLPAIPEPHTPAPARSEKWVQDQIRLEAGRKGLAMWRNNVGALLDEQGRSVRFGLANDSKKVNEFIKSADLIGIRRVVITPAHVGHTVGQFVCREVKPSDWRYTGTAREQAQMRWATLVQSFGGDAGFATGEGTL